MKVLIIYYSQTGNTQKTARSIAEGMRGDGHQVTLRFLQKASYEEMKEYDLIGFGSPIWYEMPPNMRKFIEEMPDFTDVPCFCFNTHGTLPALYFPLVLPRLRRKGMLVTDWADWYGDASIQIFPSPYYTSGHPDEQDLSEAAAFGKSVCDKAARVLEGNLSGLPPLPAPDMTPWHANAAIDHLGGFHNVHGRLVRDPEKCLYPACHICMDHCTMQYIDLAADPQKYGSCGDACDDCHGCTYCEMLCPSGAIHPLIPYEKAAPAGEDQGSGLFESVLDLAEKEGKFRRLIPAENVGTKTPFYSVHTKHPRLKALRFDKDNP